MGGLDEFGKHLTVPQNDHQRHEEEVQAGLFATKGAKGTKSAKGRATPKKRGDNDKITGNSTSGKEYIDSTATAASDGMIEEDVEQGTLF